MIVYADSSALLKRAVDEAESDALDDALETYVADGASLVSSSLAWVEVGRALRRAAADQGFEVDSNELLAGALSGVAERPMTLDVISLARRLDPPMLRTLDAIHVATAVLVAADVVVAYDERLMGACSQNGLSTSSPQ